MVVEKGSEWCLRYNFSDFGLVRSFYLNIENVEKSEEKKQA